MGAQCHCAPFLVCSGSGAGACGVDRCAMAELHQPEEAIHPDSQGVKTLANAVTRPPETVKRRSPLTRADVATLGETTYGAPGL